mmetsp:Transcript_27700/g.76253  ORF Transcript_27700/g.76253 Transcript_27700/m.76253 type:complete len:255 (-) Transcript_27700:424-1188(-)
MLVARQQHWRQPHPGVELWFEALSGGKGDGTADPAADVRGAPQGGGPMAGAMRRHGRQRPPRAPVHVQDLGGVVRHHVAVVPAGWDGMPSAHVELATEGCCPEGAPRRQHRRLVLPDASVVGRARVEALHGAPDATHVIHVVLAAADVQVAPDDGGRRVRPRAAHGRRALPPPPGGVEAHDRSGKVAPAAAHVDTPREDASDMACAAHRHRGQRFPIASLQVKALGGVQPALLAKDVHHPARDIKLWDTGCLDA